MFRDAVHLLTALQSENPQLAGTAIVNESTLTGESVPLMKEAISMPEQDRALEIKGQDKVCCTMEN
jgi:magnesium-transporting ATPase (P-type)